MLRITREMFDEITLEVSLQRLGVVELERRLEFSPLLVEGGGEGKSTETLAQCHFCKVPDDIGHPVPTILTPGSDGSTGPTDGGLGR